MRMKLLLIFLLFIIKSNAQTARCVYSVINFGYNCHLTLNNTIGFDEFTEIEGDHLENHTNEDVFVVQRQTGTSPIVPRIICSQFPNVNRISFHQYLVERVTDDSFGSCISLSWLSLVGNRISSISDNAFANNRNLSHLNLSGGLFTSLPDDFFINNVNLMSLDLRDIRFDVIPSGLFKNLVNLDDLVLQNNGFSEINPDWFANLIRLRRLSFWGGNITRVNNDDFKNLQSLDELLFNSNQLSEINIEGFSHLINLRILNFNRNLLTEIGENSFSKLSNLETLDLSYNDIVNVENGAFNGLTNLRVLLFTNCLLSHLNENSFSGLSSLENLNLNFNTLTRLPSGVFSSLASLNLIGLWGNQLNVMRRDWFGGLESIATFEFRDNGVTAVDRRIFKDAVNLNNLAFTMNVCENGHFNNWPVNRVSHMERLENCFFNYEYTVDAITEVDQNYQFHSAPQPGIVLRVQSSNEIQIALTPFNFPWTPMLEIFIGTANNTRSVIRRNQEIDVVTVPTPNIIRDDEVNSFRIVWANFVVSVFRGNEQFAFMSFTMNDFFPVNFYGLRSPESTAIWHVQPVNV